MKAVLLALALAGPAAGAEFHAGARGTSGANFLKFGTGGRALAMGGAAAAAAEDASAAYWNPAGLASSPRELSLMHARYLEAVSYTDVAGALPLGRRGEAGTLGALLTAVDFGSLHGTDATGAATGDYHPAATVLGLSYARPFRWNGFAAAWGASGRFVSFKIADTATAAAADVGARVVVSPRLAFGAALQNLGRGTRFESVRDPLPLLLRLGAAWKPGPGWTGALDVVAARDDRPVLRAGLEREVGAKEEEPFARVQVGAAPEPPKGRLLLRAGWTSAYGSVDGLAGPSAGFGWHLPSVGFDYAFIPMGDLGMTHRAGFTYRWAAPEEEEHEEDGAP